MTSKKRSAKMRIAACKGDDALVIETDEMDGLLPRTPFEKLEQYIYDGNDRNILARYCKGKFVAKPFA